MKTPRTVAWLAAGFALSSSACLPDDTRPAPARVLVTVTADEFVKSGVRTADGWAIVYDRLLLSIGRASLDGDGCTNYSEADYRRLLDARVSGPQKLSELYALGRCEFSYSVGNPRSDVLLGQGVSDADQRFMRTPGSDRYAQNRGISIYVEGRATKNALEKTFRWAFRQRFTYQACPNSNEVFNLHSGQRQTVDLPIHGESLFESSASEDDAGLGFDPYAEADDRYGNADGEVTLDELGKVPTQTRLVPSDGGSAAPFDGGLDGSSATLEDHVYRQAFPRVVGFQSGGGFCAFRVPDDVDER